MIINIASYKPSTLYTKGKQKAQASYQLLSPK